MIIKIILFLTLLSYSVLVSQSFMYMIALRNVQENMEAASYIELRKLLDEQFTKKFKWVVYTVLLLSLLLVIITAKEPSGLLFICSIFAFAALLMDTLITVKGNLPLNTFIRSWSADEYPDNWKMYRSKWLLYFSWRQLANISGFVCLLTVAIFGL